MIPMHILDASGFYAGVPFGSTTPYCTTPEVYLEIQHIKGRQKAIQALKDAGRLLVLSPDKESVNAATGAAQKTGDITELSAQDVSILALAIQTGNEIVTDDYALSNVAKHIGIVVHPVMTRGIRATVVWSYTCPACKITSRPAKTCTICGTPLRRRMRPI